MKGAVKDLLLGPAVRRKLRGWRALYQQASRCDQAAVALDPRGGRIAVLAPHMDDEVLGCGGTIARHVRAGADVAVIFLTDGRGGGTTGPARELVELRKEEGRRAAAVLGIGSVRFLDARDMDLRADEKTTAGLRDALEEHRPELVYLPFFLERHPDHRAANDVLLAAAGSASNFECRGYEVWTPLLANCLVDIDDTIDLKRTAIACYTSQLRERDYAHFALGLNAYRAAGLGRPSRFAEAFHTLPLADYRRFYRTVCLS